MGKNRVGAVLTALAVVGVLIGAIVWMSAGSGRTTAGADDPPTARPPVSTPVTDAPTAIPPVTGSPTAGGRPEHDGPPNHQDNRGAFYPKDVSPEAQARLDTEAERIRPALESVRASGTITERSVTDALVGLGYPKDTVSTLVREPLPAGQMADGTPIEQPGRAILFGITAQGGCLGGGVWADRAQVGVHGPVAEFGCSPFVTH